jgi:hypothetical protein
MSNETSTDTLNLEPEVVALAQARAHKNALKKRLDTARTLWEEAYRGLMDEVEQAEVAEKEAYTRLAASTVALFEATGEKKSHPAAEVKIADEPVFNALEAADWARKYMPGLFVFDSKAYAKMLREYSASKVLREVLPGMPGEIVSAPKAYIKADLSAYLTLTPAAEGAS